MRRKGANKMKPVIGITVSTEIDSVNYTTHKDHVRAVLQCGGIPFLIPYMTEEEDVRQIVEKVDGLYSTGGYDIDPTLFGEEPHPGLGTIIPERDTFEMMMMKQMLDEDKPILGVCRGSQILNIALGGDMYQDIYRQIDTSLLQHQQKAPASYGSHFVNVERESLLYRLTGKDKLRVNSRHHQANRNVITPLLVSGRANDGIVEAVESSNHAFVLGLQWHPENLLTKGDEASLHIFNGFIKACQEGMNES